VSQEWYIWNVRMMEPLNMSIHDLICVLLLADEYDLECFSFSEFTAHDLVRAILTVLSSFAGTDDMLLFFTKMLRELGAIRLKSGEYRAEEGDSLSEMCPWSFQVYLTVTTVYQTDVDYWPIPRDLDEEKGILDIYIPLKEITTSLETGLLRVQRDWYEGIRDAVVLLLRKKGLTESYGVEAVIFKHCRRLRLSTEEALARLKRF
jgi:hypothetical protein